MGEKVKIKDFTEVTTSYYSDGDVFYVTLGETEGANCEEMHEGCVLVRKNKDDVVVGITILDFKYWLALLANGYIVMPDEKPPKVVWTREDGELPP